MTDINHGKPKVHIDLPGGCPFMDIDSVICDVNVFDDPGWYAMATHVCFCHPRQNQKVKS